MKVLFYTHLAVQYRDIIDEAAAANPEINPVVARDRKVFQEHISDAEIIVTGSPKHEELERAGRLKMLVVPFTGTNHIDKAYLKSRNILLANSPGNGPFVAERAFAIALSCLGRIVEFHNDLKEKKWHRTGIPNAPFDLWTSLYQRRVAILGTGDIGRGIARLLQPFRCSIIGYRRGSEVPPGFDRVTADLREALASAELVFLTLPLTEQTAQLLNNTNIDLLDGKYLVNTGRGELVEEEALYQALASGRMAGAALDVWYSYPTKYETDVHGSRFPFHELGNVVLSPHAGSHAEEGKRGQLTGAVAAVASFLERGEPDTLIR